MISMGFDDAYIARFDLKGNSHWAHQIGSRNGHDYILDIDSDTNGYVYFTGRVGSGIDFDPGPQKNILSTNAEDIPLVKIDSNWNLIALSSLTGNGIDVGRNLHIGDDKIYLSGIFEHDLTLSTDSAVKVNSIGASDFFYTNWDFCDKQIIPDSIVLTAIHSNCPIDSLTPPKARNGCSGELIAATTTPFPITQKGRSTIVWEYRDVQGNTFSQTQDVLIEDQVAPVPDSMGLPRIISHCPIRFLSGNFPTATDNCNGKISGSNDIIFPIDSSTTITWTYVDSAGNTSTQTQDVIIESFDTTYIMSNNSIVANESNTSYQWLDCNNNFQPIPGETRAVFQPSTSGLYAVELSDDYCSIVLACKNVSVSTGLVEKTAEQQIAFFPNPTKGMLQIEVLHDQTFFRVTSMTGKVVYESTLSQGTQKIDLSPVVSKGSYLLHFNNGQTNQQSLLIVE
jgi:hypothetical protein